MSKLAQGTQIYFIDPENDSVVEIECPYSANPGGNPADQLEDPCLKSTTKRFKKGMRTPGKATVGIKPDPTYPSHVRLFELSESDAEEEQNIHFAIGWSDGVDVPPTVDSNGDFNLPATRTWFTFDGYVDDFPMDFATGALVDTTVSVQRTGPGVWTPKT